VGRECRGVTRLHWRWFSPPRMLAAAGAYSNEILVLVLPLMINGTVLWLLSDSEASDDQVRDPWSGFAVP
jgi:hypothetical protein